jgi:hypothetical protein
VSEPFIKVEWGKTPISLFNIVSNLIAASQFDTRPAVAGRRIEVLLDNGRGVTFRLAACDSEEEAEAVANRFRHELTEQPFKEWAQSYGISDEFLHRTRRLGLFQRFLASFRPIRKS